MNAVINSEAINTLLTIADGDPNFIDAIFDLFYSDGHARIAKMEKYFADGQFKKCADEAHAFKSSSHSLGAYQLSQYCSEIEVAEGKNLDPKIFANIREAYDLSCTELKKLRQKLPNLKKA